jgi:hypothetical protein
MIKIKTYFNDKSKVYIHNYNKNLSKNINDLFV